MAVLLVSALSVNFVACSDDDEPVGGNGNNNGNNTEGIVNPSNVFTGERPKSVSGLDITYDSEGLVTEMTTDGKKITFEYINVRNSQQNGFVRMTVVDEDEYESETYVFEMELNENGFVKHCKQIYEDGNTDTWDFGYTKESNLNYMKRSEGGNEITNITYQDGNAVKSSMFSEYEPDNKYECEIQYTSDNVATPIENKGCLMLFDETLGVDMDEMEYAYFAGLLGKATKNLPVMMTTTEGSYVDTEKYSWILNSDGYPVEMMIITDWSEEKLTFTW